VDAGRPDVRAPHRQAALQQPQDARPHGGDERWPVKFPPYMSADAKDLLNRLLERKPAKRIGMLAGRVAGVWESRAARCGAGWGGVGSREFLRDGAHPFVCVVCMMMQVGAGPNF